MFGASNAFFTGLVIIAILLPRNELRLQLEHLFFTKNETERKRNKSEIQNPK